MHPPQVREEVLALVAQGINDCEIARRTGVPRATVRDWRRPTYQSRREYQLETCPRCWRAAKPIRFKPEEYAELLGFYLGDGCITEMPRTQKLRIALDAKYPGIIESTRSVLSRCFPQNATGVTWSRSRTWLELWVHSGHMACLFPQHARGKKHLRSIRLEEWQQELVDKAPWAFLRGLVLSDGSAFINRTGPYEYLSYDFSNCSEDLIRLFTETCDSLNLDYRVNAWGRAWHVRINRRDSVARMVCHIGLKA